jgi:hypothetical protein
MALPPDGRSDEISLQIARCGRCGLAGIAVYEESRRGALGAESVDHDGYMVTAADLRAVQTLMKTCPDPKNARCTCAAHQQLGSRDAGGRWNGLEGKTLGRRFRME